MDGGIHVDSSGDGVIDMDSINARSFTATPPLVSTKRRGRRRRRHGWAAKQQQQATRDKIQTQWEPKSQEILREHGGLRRTLHCVQTVAGRPTLSVFLGRRSVNVADPLTRGDIVSASRKDGIDHDSGDGHAVGSQPGRHQTV